jgi:hypothetical protein
MRRVGSDDERPIEKDTLGLPASYLVQVPILLHISHVPLESHTAREFVRKSLHELYITPIYSLGKPARGFLVVATSIRIAKATSDIEFRPWNRP